MSINISAHCRWDELNIEATLNTWQDSGDYVSLSIKSGDNDITLFITPEQFKKLKEVEISSIKETPNI